MMVTIPNGCLASTTTRECSPDQKKGLGGMRTYRWVHIDTYKPCVGKLSTHPIPSLE